MRRNKLLLLLALLITAVTGAWADDWTNIIVNSNMEGTDASCFYVKENAKGAGNMYLAHITDGIGKEIAGNPSRAIRVRSTGTEVETWDTQFFIRLPYELPAGTQYRLSFDYKADKEADADFQCANEPSEYIIWYIGESDYNDFSFTTSWQSFSREYTVPNYCDGKQHENSDWLDNFQTIYFSLAMKAKEPDAEATEFIIDNVKVEIPTSVLNTLTPSPVTDPKLMVAYPPYTVSLAEGTVDADKWTITPTEGAYEGETVTATYNGTKKVLGVKAEKKSSAPTLKDALVDGATVVINYTWMGTNETTFTFTNNAGTFTGNVTGSDAEYFSKNMSKDGTTLNFTASNPDVSEANVSIDFYTEDNGYYFDFKGESFGSFTISVNGTDLTSQLTEAK